MRTSIFIADSTDCMDFTPVSGGISQPYEGKFKQAVERKEAAENCYVFIEVHRGPSNIAFTCSTLQYTLLYVGQGKINIPFP